MKIFEANPNHFKIKVKDEFIIEAEYPDRLQFLINSFQLKFQKVKM
jgi:hypothetical protein